MSDEHVEDGFTMPPEPATEDGDMARLVLQHCVMPTYQFIIQVAPDQTSVTHVNNPNLKYSASILIIHTGNESKSKIAILLYSMYSTSNLHEIMLEFQCLPIIFIYKRVVSMGG